MATISQALAIAIQHHQAGRLQAAEQIYRQILAVQPDHAEANHFLGMIASQVGKHQVAVEYMERAIALKGGVAAFHYNLGNAFHGQGKLDEAAACHRRALELKPDYAEASNNLGAVLRELGKLDEAVACFRRALEVTPDFVEAHVNLGVAIRGQGKPHEAVACFRRALELKPDSAAALVNLGNVLMDQGNLAEAVACFRRALELMPDSTEARINLGNALKRQGRLDDAIACYLQAAQRKPNLAAVHNNLGIAYKDQGNLDQAIACYRRAVQLKPDYAEAHNNLGVALKQHGNLEEAVACYRRAIQLKPDYAEPHSNLGVAWKEQRKSDDSLACYRRAVELKPDYVEAQGNLGIALVEIGDLAGAEDAFRAALRLDGRFALAHYQLAVLRGGKLPQEDLDAQRRLLEDAELTGEQRLLLHFGLAHVLDARGRYAEAAEHLDRGNALERSEWRKRGQEYEPKEYELLVTRMIDACTPDFFGRVRGLGLGTELPVFVVGLPRSGTTLIEQILAGHSQVFGAGEMRLARDTMTALGDHGADPIEGLGRLDRQTAVRLASRHLDGLRALSRQALRIVDKTPDNYFFLGLLASLFPRAKLIHCRRDVRDVALSCWMTHFEEVRWSNDQPHIASRFHQYQRMMAHWRKVLPAPLLEVDYEETVADLEGVARKLVAWCGLAWEPACLEFQRVKRPVRTASAVPVRQPIFPTSVGRWKHYAGALDELFAMVSQ